MLKKRKTGALNIVILRKIHTRLQNENIFMHKRCRMKFASFSDKCIGDWQIKVTRF